MCTKVPDGDIAKFLAVEWWNQTNFFLMLSTMTHKLIGVAW